MLRADHARLVQRSSQVNCSFVFCCPNRSYFSAIDFDGVFAALHRELDVASTPGTGHLIEDAVERDAASDRLPYAEAPVLRGLRTASCYRESICRMQQYGAASANR